jgi:hypothetical protein
MRRARAQFQADGTLYEREKYLAIAEGVNRAMLSQGFKTYSPDRISQILTSEVGFKTILTKTRAYGGQNFLVNLRK